MTNTISACKEDTHKRSSSSFGKIERALVKNIEGQEIDISTHEEEVLGMPENAIKNSNGNFEKKPYERFSHVDW